MGEKMSRTREINVFLNRFENFDNASISYKKCDVYCVKAKLIIELPERKVTISESDFMKSLDKYCFENAHTKSLSGMMAGFKEDLFKDA